MKLFLETVGQDGTSYEEIASKSVTDTDGFYTDYTMYYDIINDKYVFVFGDKDIYTPYYSDHDWECETEEEAWEWYNDYNGFEDEDIVEESLKEDTIKTKDGKWTNKGKEGTHGKFKTKKEADAQRRAIYANGFKGESLKESKTEGYSFSDLERAVESVLDRYGFKDPHYSLHFLERGRGNIPYLEVEEYKDGFDYRDYVLIKKIFGREVPNGFTIDVIPGRETTDGNLLSIIFEPMGERHYYATGDENYSILAGKYRTESLKESDEYKTLAKLSKGLKEEKIADKIRANQDTKEMTRRAIKILKDRGGEYKDLAKEFKDTYGEAPLKESSYSKKYGARAYYGTNFSGLESNLDSNDWSKIEDFCHDRLMNGCFCEIKNNESGKSVRITPDEYIDNFDGEFIYSAPYLEEDLIDDMEGKVIKRYSDVYDDKVKQRGWWYFTTHGVQPGSIPSDLHVLEIRDGKNDKGTMGTFVRLDGILNTSELKKFDMKEMSPLNEDSRGDFSYERRLLGRLKADCDYVLKACLRNGMTVTSSQTHLWAGSVGNQIAKMRELHSIVPNADDIVTEEQIDDYEKKFRDELKKEDISECLKEDWYHFEFASGSNPYITKDDREKKRILRKYKGKVTEVKPNFYRIDDREVEKEVVVESSDEIGSYTVRFNTRFGRILNSYSKSFDSLKQAREYATTFDDDLLWAIVDEKNNIVLSGFGKRINRKNESIKESKTPYGDTTKKYPVTEANLTKAQRHNRNMDKIFSYKRATDNAMKKYLIDNGVSEDEAEKLRQADKLDYKLRELGLHDDFFDMWGKRKNEGAVVKRSHSIKESNTNAKSKVNLSDVRTLFRNVPKNIWGVYKDGDGRVVLFTTSAIHNHWYAMKDFYRNFDYEELGTDLLGRDCYWVKSKKDLLPEDVRKEWKPNTNFKHIKDVLETALERGKYVNNEREEVMAALDLCDKKKYTPDQRKFIRDSHQEMWRKNRKTESISRNKRTSLKEAKQWSTKYPQYEYEFDDGIKVVAIDEVEAREKYNDIIENRYNGVRSKDDIDNLAQSLYDSGDFWSFNYFSDEELAMLWALCNIGRAYDDEVYEAIYTLPDPQSIFKKAQGYYDEYSSKDKLSEKTLKEAVSQDIIDAIMWNYGCSRTEAKKLAKDMDEERKDLLVQGWKDQARKSFYESFGGYDFTNFNDYLSDNFAGYNDDYVDELMRVLNKCAKALGTTANKLVFYTDYNEDLLWIADEEATELKTLHDYPSKWVLYQLNSEDIKFVIHSNIGVFNNESDGEKVISLFDKVNHKYQYGESLNEDFSKYDFINYNDFLADNFSGYGDDDYIDKLMKDLNKCARVLSTKADKLVFYIDYDEDFYAIDDIASVESYISEDHSLYKLNGTDIKFIVNHSFSSSYWIFKNEAEGNKVVGAIKTYVASLNESLLIEGMVDMSDDFNAAREKWDELDIKISFDDALEKWNKTSKLAEPGHWYAKPLYSEQAWNDMVKMFDK